MFCIRVSINGSFVGLVHNSDRVVIRGLVKRFGIESLILVPVVAL